MSEFNVRADSLNVEQIMEQIRGRIREKRGVDYTEQQLQELAAVKLEKLLDPRGLRSDLVEQFRKRRPEIYEPQNLPPVPDYLPSLPALAEIVAELSRAENYTFEAETIYETHRAPLRFMRRLLNPILKLLFNPNPLILALHRQVEFNKVVNRALQLIQVDQRDRALLKETITSLISRQDLIVERDSAREQQRVERREMDALYYEIIHNLVFELTRVAVENKNLKMRMESLASRLEFNERRARALETVVVYKPADGEAGRDMTRPAPAAVQQTSAPPPGPEMVAPGVAAPTAAPGPEGPGQRSRRRRRRRGRRSGSASGIMGGPSTLTPPSSGPGPSTSASASSGQASSAPSIPRAHEGRAEDDRGTVSAEPAPPAPDAARREAGPIELSESVARTIVPQAQPGEARRESTTPPADSGGGREPAVPSADSRPPTDQQ